MITLEPKETDNINQMITITGLLYNNLLQWGHNNVITLGPRQSDPINRMIPLTDMHFSINSKQALNIILKMIPLTE